MISIRFDPPLSLIEGRFGHASERLARMVEGELEKLAGDVRDVVAAATPGEQLPDAWAVRRQNKLAGAASFILENQDPRFDELVELSDGRLTNLGEMLEYGTRPHLIKAMPGGLLAFFWPAVGRMVFARSVEHPGTKPYAMMRRGYGIAVGGAARIAARVRLQMGGSAP